MAHKQNSKENNPVKADLSAVKVTILTVLEVIGLFVVTQLVGVGIDSAIHMGVSTYPSTGVFYILCAMLVMFVYTKKQKNLEFLCKGGDYKLGFTLGMISVVYSVGYLFFASAHLTFELLLLALCAGIAEETFFRGIMISSLIKKLKFSEKNVLPIALISAGSFGLIHLTNLAAGAAIGITLFQVFNAASIGVFYCAIYLRSGNLLPCMLCHTVQDCIAFLNTTLVAEGGVMTETIFDASCVYDTVWSVVLFGAAVYLLRPTVRNDIIKIWKQKWQIAEQ